MMPAKRRLCRLVRMSDKGALRIFPRPATNAGIPPFLAIAAFARQCPKTGRLPGTTARRPETPLTGTVNLIGSGRDTGHEGRAHCRLCPSGHAGDRGPGLEGLGPGSSILGGGEVIAAEVEQVVDLAVSGEKPLGLTG